MWLYVWTYLFFLELPWHFGKTIIGELPRNIVLIDALKQSIQFFITGLQDCKLFLVSRKPQARLRGGGRQKLNAELSALSAKKEALLAEYKSTRAEAQEYETVRQNVDALLSVPKMYAKEISNIRNFSK